ncbi:MAG TPA: hypothetical protein VH969_11940 [Actinophytocola sp.]|jgi:hypothetical protein|uniref:hypothetical protein n=1 Tax=Actinophytocola sp. TaxID=1872138 RepID=UPI002F92807D
MEVVETTEVRRCVECGDELAPERAELGYAYCLKETCQAKHRQGVVITTVGTNKGADTVIVGDPDEVRRRGETGELARKDTGLGLGYGSVRAGGAGAPRGRGTPTPPRAPARRPWTPEQEKLVRLYHDMGLDPRAIAERARRNNPRLGITERLAVQILSAPPSRR